MVEPTHADVIVIPVHNRRETTLACLRGLREDGVFSWATVLVVDDGSTDGTSEAIAAEFPAAGRLRGDGTWWWGGAIRRGMEQAMSGRAARIFWLNDDCRPPPGGLRALREFVEREACIAWIEAHAPGGWNCGGYRRTAWGVRRCTSEEEAAGLTETFSGNCVCFPREWVERVGLPHDHLFPQATADLDYGLRLHAAGARLRSLPGQVADNLSPSPAAAESWLTSERSMREIWRDFSSPRSYLHFSTWRHFALRHWGLLWGGMVFAAPYARWLAIATLRSVAPGTTRAWARRRAVNSPNGRRKD